MSLPRLRTKDGRVLDLEWTRLLTVAEAGVSAPSPSEPRWRPGLVLGPPEVVVEGSGFDRREVVRRQVLSDDGVHVVGGVAVQGRSRAGERVSYEPARAWTPADWSAVVDEAREILRQHQFPVDLEWPSPSAWAWSEGRLYWANAPEDGVFVFEDGREESALMSGVERGGLGWPETARKPDARALSGWPRFSAFGWAIEIFDAHHFRNGATDVLCRFALQAQLAGWGGGDPVAVEGDARAIWPAREAESLWRLGFAAGAYLAEHRIRANHAELLERGERNKAATAAGAAVTNATRTAERNVLRAKVLAKARSRLEEGQLPAGYAAWDVEALTQDVRDHWGVEDPPAARKITAALRHLLKEGDLSLPER